MRDYFSSIIEILFIIACVFALAVGIGAVWVVGHFLSKFW